MRNKAILRFALCLLILLTLSMPLSAAASGDPVLVSDSADGGITQINDDTGGEKSSTPETPKEAKFIITIKAPSGWYTKTATATVKLEDINGTGFSKAETKCGQDGKWQDVTDALRSYGSANVELSDNGTIYVAVTDLTGKAHMRSLYVECFDREVPTVRARIDGRTLRVEADDALSGVATVYVNGYDFDDLKNGTLDISVKEYADKNYEDILVYAVDLAGNRSKTVSVKNPYYESESSKASSSAPGESASSQASSSQPASSQPAPAAPASASSAPTASQPAASSSASHMQGASSQAETPAVSSDVTNESGSVTPTDGSGSVIENSVKTSEQREFFTITTERGNDYYIVIDKEKSDKNVYLLSAVTEEDLVGLTEQSDPAAPEPLLPPEVTTPVPEPEPTTPADSEPESEPMPQPEKSSDTGAMVLIVVCVLAFGGVAYYFKILRPKHNPPDSDYEEDDGDDSDYPGDPEYEDGGDGYESETDDRESEV